MAKDDSNGGFLSKVVKFVRHPTTSWSDLDTRSADRESEYNKAALKEMIERKRRNDFVRKREFDMLRKIRSREGVPLDGQGMRPSFFQSSLPSKPDDRAETLKKIDEIEAQMSMQWWKTKGPDSLVSTGSGLNTAPHGPGGANSRKDEAPALATPDPVLRQHRAQYDETEPGPLPNPASSVLSVSQALERSMLDTVPASAPAPLRSAEYPMPEGEAVQALPPLESSLDMDQGMRVFR